MRGFLDYSAFPFVRYCVGVMPVSFFELLHKVDLAVIAALFGDLRKGILPVCQQFFAMAIRASGSHRTWH